MCVQRSNLDPAWNHYIRSLVRIWSQDGIDENALAVLPPAGFRTPAPDPDPADEHLQVPDDPDAALRHLRDIHGSY